MFRALFLALCAAACSAPPPPRVSLGGEGVQKTEAVNIPVCLIETSKGYGNGVYLGGRLVATVLHLFPPGEIVEAEFNGEGQSGVLALLKGKNDKERGEDWVILRTELSPPPGIPRVDFSLPLQPGDELQIVGYLNIGNVYRKVVFAAKVLGPPPVLAHPRELYLSVPGMKTILPGLSGSPVVRVVAGEPVVVGILSHHMRYVTKKDNAFIAERIVAMRPPWLTSDATCRAPR